MKLLSHEAVAAIHAHVLAAYPCEAGGLIVNGSFLPCENLATDKHRFYEIDAALVLALGDTVEGFIHSHPEGYPVPSEADMAQQQAMDIPWGICSVHLRRDRFGAAIKGVKAPDDLVVTPLAWFGDGAPKGPLARRGFHHGHQDCWNAIRDWHKAHGICVIDPPRDWEWWLKTERAAAKDYYRTLLGQNGFDPVDGPRPGAIFVVPIGKDRAGERVLIPNHAGIWLGGNVILHHLTAKHPLDPDCLSGRSSFGLWKAHFNADPLWFRHRDLAAEIDRTVA